MSARHPRVRAFTTVELLVVISIVGPGLPQIVMILGLQYGIAGSRIVRGAVISTRHWRVHFRAFEGGEPVPCERLRPVAFRTRPR